ncbi:MAG: cytochrome c biogenesis protein ResB [Thermincolia bacterium]
MGNLLRSKKLAIGLIIILALEIALATIIPQKSTDNQTFMNWAWDNPGLASLVNLLGYNNFYGSPVFLLTVAIFWVNITMCTINQIKTSWRRFSTLRFSFHGTPLFSGIIEPKSINTATKHLLNQVNAMGFLIYKDCYEENTRIVAQRNRWGLWGMSVFHFGLLWIITASAYGAATSIEGNAFIAEDLGFVERHQDYANVYEGMFFGENHQGFEILINQVLLKYNSGKPPRLEGANISIREMGREVKSFPLYSLGLEEYKGYKLRLGKRRGYTPVIKIVDGNGREYLNYLSLDVVKVPGGENYKQKLFISDLGLEVDVWLFPSPPDNQKRVSSYEINRPQLEISYVDKGKKLTQVMGLEQTIIIEGKQVTLVDVKRWVEMYIFKTPGVYQVYFAFLVVLIGMIIHYGFPYQRLDIEVSVEGKMKLYGHTKLYPVSFESMVNKNLLKMADAGYLKIEHQEGEEEELW